MRSASVLKRNTILRDTVMLAGGGLLAQILSLAAAPLLARIYVPEEFGVFAIYAFVVTVPAALVSLSYEAAIPLPKDDRDARHLLMLSVLISASMATAAIGVSFAGHAVARLVNVPALAPLLAFVPLNLLAVGLYQVFTYWSNRTGGFGRLAVSRLIQSATTTGGQLGGGMLGAGVGGLVVGQVLGQLAAPAYLGWHAVRRGEIDPRERFHASLLIRVLHRYRRFPLFTTWGTLTSAISFQVVPVLLSRQFGPAEAGLYFFGYRLVSSGVLLITSSIGQVFYQRTSAALNTGAGVGPLTEAVLGRLVVLSALLLGPFALVAPQLFAFLFGVEWATAGMYMRIVSPMFFLQLVAAPISMVLFPLDKQHVAAFVQVALLVGAMGALTLAGLLHASAALTLALYGFTQSLTYFIYLLIILRLAAVSPRGLWKAIAAGAWVRGSE